MKICVYNVTSTMDAPGTREVGGTEEFSFRIAEAWREMGHQVVLVGGNPREGVRTRTTTVPLKLFAYRETSEFPNLGTRFRKLMQRIDFGRRAMAYVREAGFDLVLAFKPYDLVPFYFGRLRREMRVLFRFGGTDFFVTDRWWAGAAHAFFANSEETARKVCDRFGRPCRVISNGVTLPHRAAVIDGGARTIFSAGRLVGWKGYSWLIESLSPLRNRKNWRLVLMGEGGERSALEELVREFGLQDRVEFTGSLPPVEVRGRLQGGGLYVQPSIGYDSCPNAVMEAMAAGLPVVISSEVGHVEGFEESIHGLVVPVDNRQLLAEAIIRYLDEPAAHGRYGRAARELMSERHTIERIARQTLELGDADRAAPSGRVNPMENRIQ